MALLFFDGFEGTTTIADLVQRGWTNPVGAISDGRTGLRGWVPTNLSNVLQWDAAVADRSTRMIVGAALRQTGVGGINTIAIRDTTGSNIALVTVNQGTAVITLTVRGTLASTVSLVDAGLSPTSWNYIEINCFQNTITGTVRVQINGVAVAGLDFNGNTGTNPLASATFGVIGGAAGTRYDDIYILNGAGSTHTAFLGDVSVEPLYPNGAGASTQFTPTSGANWTNVDETDRSTADNVSSSTVGNTDLYTLGDLPANVVTVHGVRALGYWQKSDAGARTANLPIRSGGTTNNGASYVLPTSYSYALRLLPLNPVTGVAWTISEVNALEAGVRVES